METSRKINRSYDHVLIGYNLSSFSFAVELAKKGESFCLVDSKHFGSSPFKNVSSLDQEIYTRVPFNSRPQQELSVRPDLGSYETADSIPMTFDKGEFKSFLGFGDKKVEALDGALPFCQPQKLTAELSPEDYWSQNIERVQDHLFLDQKMTNLEFEDDQITHIELNAKMKLEGKNFYFFEHFHFLFDRVGSKVKKIASQFAKPKWYSSVSLIIHHKEKPETYELDQIYLLMGSKEQPCLGQFSTLGEQLISRWEVFLPAELTPDSETTGAALKEIKKQLKRAFSIPGPSTNPEHIVLHNRVYADLSGAGLNQGKLGNFSNLNIYSPLFEGSTGWLHEILCGHQAISKNDSSEKNEAPSPIEVAAPHATC